MRQRDGEPGLGVRGHRVLAFFLRTVVPFLFSSWPISTKSEVDNVVVVELWLVYCSFVVLSVAVVVCGGGVGGIFLG
jgi:hypothetical protein